MKITLKMGFRTGAGLIVATLLVGCAGVDFYSDASLTKKTGIPIYGAKPYVLVTRTKSKDKPVEVSIQYLTDYSQVIYANPRSGFGSADLKLTLSNGQLTQFGQVTDTKVPELIEAVSGLLTARATAVKSLAEADQIRSTIGVSTTQAAKVPDAATTKAIRDLLQDMSGAKADIAKLDAKGEQPIIARVMQALSNLNNPANASLLSKYGDELIAAAKDFANLPGEATASSARATALQRVRDWKPRLAAIVEKLTPDEDAATPAAADFELYEIRQDSGNVILRRVR